MFRVFKITKTHTEPKQKEKGDELLGLLIVQTDEGFYVVAPDAPSDPPRILAKSGLINFTGQPPLFKFGFEFKKANWILNCDQAIPSLQNPDELKGKWTSLPEQDEDSWTASGTKTPEELGDDEARAASAY